MCCFAEWCFAVHVIEVSLEAIEWKSVMLELQANFGVLTIAEKEKQNKNKGIPLIQYLHVREILLHLTQ